MMLTSFTGREVETSGLPLLQKESQIAKNWRNVQIDKLIFFHKIVGNYTSAGLKVFEAEVISQLSYGFQIYAHKNLEPLEALIQTT